MNRIFNFKLFFIAAVLFLLLSRFAYLMIFPPFMDESVYARMTDVMSSGFKENAYFCTRYDEWSVKPFFLWVGTLFKIVLKKSLLSLRFISALSGILSGLIVYLIIFNYTRSITSSLIILFLYSVSPFNLFIERLALFESLVNLFTVLTLLSSFMILKTSTPKKIFLWNFIAGISLGLAFMTKTTALPFFIVPPAVCLFKIYKNKKTFKLYIAGILLFFITSFVFYLPVFLNPEAKLLVHRFTYKAKWVSKSGLTFTNYFSDLKNIIFFFIKMCVYYIPWIIVISAAYILITEPVTIVFILPLLSWLLINSIEQSRYFYPFTVILFPLAGIGIAKFKKKKILYVSILTLFIIQSLFIFFVHPVFENDMKQYISGWGSGFGLNKIKKRIDDISDKQKINLFLTLNWGNPASYLTTEFCSNPNVKIYYNYWNFYDIGFENKIITCESEFKRRPSIITKTSEFFNKKNIFVCETEHLGNLEAYEKINSEITPLLKTYKPLSSNGFLTYEVKPVRYTDKINELLKQDKNKAYIYTKNLCERLINFNRYWKRFAPDISILKKLNTISLLLLENKEYKAAGVVYRLMTDYFDKYLTEVNYLNMGAAFFYQNNHKKALAIWQKGLKKFPKSVNLLKNINIVKNLQ